MSIRSTKAYSRYKLQADALLDFVVLVAHSIPVLRAEIQKVKSGTLSSLPRPDFFHKSNRSTPDDLLKTEAHYEQHLASYVLLTHFSFFESFVEDLIKEMIAFHGGESEFISRIEKRVARFLVRQAPDKTKLKRRLQDTDKPEWRDRYRKFSHQLDKDGFRFPGELLAAYGVRNLVSKMKTLKAVHIPDVLVEALRVDLTKAEIEKYHEIREIRNTIAHGNPVTLTMRQAVEMTAALRGLAIKIASHTAENFFLIEKYIP